MEELSLTATAADSGKRIDTFLAEQIDGSTRAAVQQLLSDGCVTSANCKLKKSTKLSGNETIIVTMPEPKMVDIIPENIPLAIVYEDDDIVVINKARGMVVHPAVGNWSGTLVNALMYHCGDSLSGINGELRPGIVHRIDKDTSGLLVVAKNDMAHQSLAAQIAAHTAHRGYEAVVIGHFKEPDGMISMPLARHPVDRKRMAVVEGGREAITHYHTICGYRGYSHMSFRLETGRTHQIRVHMAAVGHPIVGDPLYGLKKDRFSNIGGQCLHASKLILKHPRTQQEMQFFADLPPYFTDILSKLERMQ